MTRGTRVDRAESRRRARSRFEGHRTERREELLDAATEVVRRLGADTTMEAVAAEVGVAKPVLYRYFGDRSGLFDALTARFSERMVRSLRQALAMRLPPRTQVDSAVDAYVRVVESDPQLYRFATLRMRSESANAGGVLDEATTMLTQTLGEALRAVGRDSGFAEVWAAGLVGMVHVATDRWLDHPVMPRAALVEHISELLWSGLGAVFAQPTPDPDGAAA